CAATIIILCIGETHNLINYVSFINYLSYGVTIAGLLFYRWKKPNLYRPIKRCVQERSGARRCEGDKGHGAEGAPSEAKRSESDGRVEKSELLLKFEGRSTNQGNGFGRRGKEEEDSVTPGGAI
ncbi:hypothetical protein CRENBAI_010244, partial [Crenichthys baileyi]